PTLSVPTRARSFLSRVRKLGRPNGPEDREGAAASLDRRQEHGKVGQVGGLRCNQEGAPIFVTDVPPDTATGHAADQITDFRTHSGPCATTGLPAPIEPEALAMPPDHGCGFDQYHRIDDPGPDPVEQHP